MSNMLEYRTPGESAVTMTQMVLPNDTNLLGNLLGGTLMHWMDIAAAMAASRHSRRVVATVSVDSIEFRHPIKMGEMVTLNAKLTWTGRTSMEVLLYVYSENMQTGKVTKTNKAFLSFVALDESGRPVEVPPLRPETEEEKKLYCNAEERRVERLRKKLAAEAQS